MNYKYQYELKLVSSRNSVNLIDHAISITNAVNSVFSSSLISLKIHQRYYEYEIDHEVTRSEIQKVGKELVQLDPILNEMKAIYSGSTQLFAEKK
ncbi:MAG: hypothetical protein ACRCX2_16275 [Paraclostridium sp.]